MSQITLYLDDETAARMKAAAAAAGLSQSRWVARLIQQKTATQWPDSVASLAGAWSDLSASETLRESTVDDVPREQL